MQVNVQIVLATYNGELFLQQQIESLLQQTYSDFTILIRDDGSTKHLTYYKPIKKNILPNLFF